MRKHAFFSNLLSGPKGPSKFQPWANSNTSMSAESPTKSVLGPHVLHPNTRAHIENGSYKPTYHTTPGSYFDTNIPRAIPIDESTTSPVVPRQPTSTGTTKGPNGWQLSPQALQEFRKGTASQYDPNSRVDRAKMEALLSGKSDWAIRKSAFIKRSTMGDQGYRRERDEKALRNRHIALSLKRAAQLGLLGSVVGGMKAGSGNEGQGALVGALMGSLAGGGIGAMEGATKRTLGLDPILDTTLIAHRA